MPIVLVRVDNRLVHGQILSAWMPALDADGLLVADDEAAGNSLVQSAMAIALPPEVELEVVPTADARRAIEKLPSGRRVIVLVRDVADAVRLVESGAPVQRLNLGNVHFTRGRAPVSQAVYLSPDEVQVLKKIEAAGVEVELRTLPRDPSVPLGEVSRRVAEGQSR